LNKTSGQSCFKKSTISYICERREYIIMQFVTWVYA
jgi:hypothetical protein